MKRILILLSLFAGIALSAATHPTLLLTKKGVADMKESLGSVPKFDLSVEQLLAEADAALLKPICIPEPKDGGGGYSHEMHKLNYYDMYACVSLISSAERRHMRKR